MTFNRDALLQALNALTEDAESPRRYVVGFSGGLDSTVLLHALAETAAEHKIPLLAIHVDHGMQPESGSWAERCQATAEQFGIEFRLQRVVVDLDGGLGPEAAARAARYAALSSLMSAGDWLLSAHHEDDQAETLLLNLMRGSGPAGLAGIAAIRRLEPGWLARPLLSFPRAALEQYAAQHGLSWIEDPSNAERSLDRNYLRHEVLPLLEARWPGASQRLNRSSRIAADAAAMLDDLAAIDVAALGGRYDRLQLDGLVALSGARQRNLLRYAIKALGFAAPSAVQLQRIIDEVVLARADAEPVLAWSDVEVRRFRKQLYILQSAEEESTPAAISLGQHDYQDLGAGRGALRLEHGVSQGLDSALLQRGLELKYRQGGEKIKPINQSHTKTLKNLLNEESIVPWMRDRIPLLYAGDRLVAVADLWLAQDAVASPGVAIHWENRPPIH